MIIFATDTGLMRLSTCKTNYMDGAFKTCPWLFAQFFSIHGLVNDHVVPLVFVLLSDKLAATYYRLFSCLREAIFKLGSVLDPKIIFTDFESDLIECFRNQFPSADHLGCNFHFTQAVWHKVQNLGLASAYHNEDNTEIAEFIQLCMALAFILEVEIASQFKECITNSSAESLNLLGDFIKYFRNTWVSGLFRQSMWNKYGKDHLRRTNN